MELFKEQIDGVEYILKAFINHKGFLLADRMGLGKTAQAISLMKRIKGDGKTLIIAPAYICFNWLIELEKWGIDISKIQWVKSSKDIIIDKSIYIISYNMVTNTNIFKQLFKLEYSLIICDESHYLKTWNSKRSRLILGTFKNKKTNLLQRTKRILCLTGTPILNRVEELYNQIARIAPGVISQSRDDFTVYFSKYVEYTPWGIKARGIKNEKELLNMIKPVFLSRQIIEGLTERFDKTIFLEAIGPGVKDYINQEERFLKDNNIKNLEDLLKVNTIEVEFLSELRQKVALSKIPKLIDSLADIIDGNEKFVVYCYHRNVQRVLYERVKLKYPTKNIKVINGSVSKEKRMSYIKDYDVLLATISSLREGVNLINANKVLFLELDWTPANIEQAIARLHRRGQTKEVFVYYFLYTTGIDKYISKMVSDKGKMIKKIHR